MDSPYDERRRFPRAAGRPVPIDLLIGNDDQAQLSYFVDKSEGGLRLKTATPVPVGTVLRARPGDAPAGEPWVTAKVRWIAATEGVYDIGCEFTETPPWATLLLFG